MDYPARLRGIMHDLRTVLIHENAQGSSGGIPPHTQPPLDAEYEKALAFHEFQEGCDCVSGLDFHQHGTNPQWVADQVRKIEREEHMSDLRKIEAMQTKYADINNLSKDEVQEVYGFFLDMKAKFSGLAFHCRNHLSLMKDAELAELRVKLAAMEGR